MKKAYTILLVALAIILVAASLSFGVTNALRTGKEIAKPPVITAGPPMNALYGQTFQVSWTPAQCKPGQSGCVTGYQVMVDFDSKKGQNIVWSTTNPNRRTFQYTITAQNTPLSKCDTTSTKHWIHVVAVNRFQKSTSSNQYFKTIGNNTINTLQAVANNDGCIPEINVTGTYDDRISSFFTRAYIQLRPLNTYGYVVKDELDEMGSDSQYIIPAGDSGWPNINTSLPIGSRVKSGRSYNVRIVLRTNQRCLYPIDLGNVTFYRSPELTCQYNVYGPNYVETATCGNSIAHFYGRVIDPMNCIENIIVTLKDINGNVLSTGNAWFPSDSWEYKDSSLAGLNPGDLVKAEISYTTGESGYTEPISCDAYVQRDITEISASFSGSKGICNGELWSWGSNESGQMGIGRVGGEYSTPTQVNHLNNLSWQSVSSHDLYSSGITLALDCNGQVWSWGDNTNGCLGINIDDGLNYTTPQLLQFLPPIPTSPTPIITYISQGQTHAHAIDNTGQLWGWGERDCIGLRRIFGSPTYIIQPVPINTPEPIKQVVAGDQTTLAIGTSGKIYGWGTGPFNGTSVTQEYTPLQIGVRLAQKVSTADGHWAYLSNGNIYIWGWPFGTTSYMFSPTIVDTVGLSPDPSQPIYWTDVSVGYKHFFAIDTNNQLWGMGFDVWGVIDCSLYGIITYYNSPQQIKIKESYTSVHDVLWWYLPEKEGNDFVLAVDISGHLWGWGSNSSGQIALPTSVARQCNPGGPILFGDCNSRL